jgi:hypothetical protein
MVHAHNLKKGIRPQRNYQEKQNKRIGNKTLSGKLFAPSLTIQSKCFCSYEMLCCEDEKWQPTVSIAAGVGLKTVCPVAILKRNVIIKLSKSFLGRVRPQTKADSEL